jgi:uncharacterized membrane protein
METSQQQPFKAEPVAGGVSQAERVAAAVGYLGILCLIPLFAFPSSAFARHHGRQGLVILCASVILWAGNIVPIFGQIAWVLGSIALFIGAIIGAVNALNGRMWEMPVLGRYAKMIKL